MRICSASPLCIQANGPGVPSAIGTLAKPSFYRVQIVSGRQWESDPSLVDDAKRFVERPKSEMCRRITERLYIELSSLVFLGVSKAECAEVRRNAPKSASPIALFLHFEISFFTGHA